MPDPRWTGIARYGAGWRASVSRGYGRTPLRRQFPLATDLKTMQAWRAKGQADVRAERRHGTGGTFAADAKRYLLAVAALPTITDRRREIALWVDRFGPRVRSEITAAEIRTQRDAWMTAPRAGRGTTPVAYATINKRLRALRNLWTVLDGPRAENPVRDVPELPGAPPKARALDFTVIEQALASMPDLTNAPRGEKRPAGSKSLARLRVMAYTGWPGAVVATLTPADVDLDQGVARLPARRKGAGAPPVLVPLLPQAVDALRTFARLDCWGPFSRRSLLTSWQRALTRLGLPPARVYDLRHSFGTALLAASKDEGAVQALFQHADVKTTHTYTTASVPPRLVAARDALSATLPNTRLRKG